MNYLEAFRRSARVHADDVAVVTVDGREFTYADLDDRSTRLASALHERIPGERCAGLALNCPAAIESMIGNQKRGKATVQLPFRGSADELSRMAETADARGLLFDDANAETALSLLDRGDFEAAIHAGDAEIDREGVESYEEVIAAADDDLPPGLPDGNGCSIFYTSGTTSLPKAVPLDQESMWLAAMQVSLEMSLDQHDVAFLTTPWYHLVTAGAWIYPHLLVGGTLVLHPSFDPEEALRLMAEHDATGLLAVPTQLRDMNEVQAEAGYDVSSLDYIRTGGAIVPADLVEDTAEHLTPNVFNTYGLTEGGPNLTFAHPSVQDEHTGTIGKESYLWEVRIVETAPPDEHPDPEAIVEPPGRGELIGRSPGSSTGYIDNPEAEARTYFDGWIRTKDVAELDEDGYIYIVDRVDNMIVSGGENIYPAEVERALEEHGDVREAAVFGLEDERWGERVAAVVVVRGAADEDDLDRFLKEGDTLADFKRPRQYAITEEPLPRSDTGTVLRGDVRERYLE